MPKILSNLSLVLLLLTMAACSTPANEQTTHSNITITSPPEGLAQILFLRPYHGIITESDIELFRIGRERTPIAALPEGFQLVHNIAPGNHTFMGYQNGRANFIEASLIAGKRYYILIDPINSRENALLAIDQQQRDSKLFSRWQSLPAISSQHHDNNPHHSRYQQQLDSAQVVAWQRWQQLNKTERRKLRLQSQDGISLRKPD